MRSKRIISFRCMVYHFRRKTSADTKIDKINCILPYSLYIKNERAYLLPAADLQ